LAIDHHRLSRRAHNTLVRRIEENWCQKIHYGFPLRTKYAFEMKKLDNF
jgi:hypothetical protein